MTQQLIRLDYRVTKAFFDSPAVIKRLTEAERRAMSRIGAFIRRRSRTSLRRRKSVSAPGSTPSVHSRSNVATLKNILFAYEASKHRVIVGPVKLNQVNSTDNGRLTVPEIHEFGATVRIHEMRFRGNGSRDPSPWFRRDMRRSIRPWQEARVRNATYPKRPTMGPALDKEIAAGTITDAWRATVTQ